MKSVPWRPGMFLQEVKIAGIKVTWPEEWGDEAAMEKVVQSRDAWNFRKILKALVEGELLFSEDTGSKDEE